MKALIITSQLVQDHEFIYPFYRLKEEGIEVEVYNQSNQIVKGYFGTKVPPQKDDKIINLQNLRVGDYNMLILPGGVKSMELLRLDDKAIDVVKKFNENNKLIAAICSGTMMLISAKITKNKKISGYYAWKDDIENSGAIFIDEPAVVDENIVTSPHYKYVGPWMKLALKTLKDLK